jgi:nucleotide-binding universal stress UspA family protein
MKEIKNILFPIDFSIAVPKIIPFVKTFSLKFEAAIHLLHAVGDFSYMGGFDVAYPSIEELENQIIASAVRKMDQVCEEDLQGCPLFIKEIKVGDPGLEIVKYAEEKGIDLIIMGTHGRKTLAHLLMGSVAEQVVRNSPVPVLTVNPYKI